MTMLLSNLLLLAALAGDPILIASPGLPPSSMDAAGRLVGDWGSVGLVFEGDGVIASPVSVEPVTLVDVVPAARASADLGIARASWTAFRSPVYPAGVDVLTVRLEARPDSPAKVVLRLDLPQGLEPGLRTLRLGGRTLVTLPDETTSARTLRDWGSADESSPNPGWAKPEGSVDPAFRNIRAGMGGVPIVYRFRVDPGSSACVVLGFCESHWPDPGQRPLVARVEGAEVEQIDPVARWGRHHPGALAFAARDADSNGLLDIQVRCAPDAPDRNPILNAIWIFPPGEPPDLTRVVAGELSTSALRYVDVGGPGDQTLYTSGPVEYAFDLAPGASVERTFLIASPGASSPSPALSAWTPETLLDAARDVWRDWNLP